eukprot:GAHX01001505.1.p1 GENE.GAHX01001505.1~~GAHX01001505.1.p1  ORF type:complete len:951 (-),score=242.41 GAHX01001505.1:214-3066(-)
MVNLPSHSAKKFPFKLDKFQSDSIKYLEENTSVFIAAHTSAGKTVIAEYAIALGLKNHQRVIYTSPIKALSNQKFKDFKDEFGDVGLLTGDINIDTDTTVLVCTTEILRNMLYRGSEILSEVAYVIFDEVHYMRDRDRGTVWEESIILLDPKICLVFLSATLSNATEFAGWVEWLKNKPCKVVTTDKRPVPLEYRFSSNDGQLVTFKDFISDDARKKKFTVKSIITQRPQVMTARRCLNVLLTNLIHNKEDPIIVFSFSRHECNDASTSFMRYNKSRNFDLTTKRMVEQVFNNGVSALNEHDQNMPQVLEIKEKLLCGIGIHHSGLLSVLKEIVELLFAENLLLVLFATETFAMGVNMPARTVVFRSVSKYDGVSTRLLQSAEFTQMSGRAGRRGKDPRGLVIMLGAGIDASAFFEGENYKSLRTGTVKTKLSNMIKGKAAPLESSFKLSFNMVLNISRVQFEDPFLVIKKSFKQYQDEMKNKRNMEGLDSVKGKLIQYQNDPVLNQLEKSVYSFIQLLLPSITIKAKQTNANIKRSLIKEEELNTLRPEIEDLSEGQLVFIESIGYGIVLRKRYRFAKQNKLLIDIFYLDFLYLINERYFDFKNIKNLLMYFKNIIENCDSIIKNRKGLQEIAKIRTVNEKLIKVVFNAKLPVPVNLMDSANKEILVERMLNVLKLGIPCLYKNTVSKISAASEYFLSFDLSDVSNNKQKTKNNVSVKYLKRLLEKHTILDSLTESEQTQLNKFKEELQGKLALLKKYDYISFDNLVLLKGRVASEVSTSDEILGTEALFQGVFNNLPVKYSITVLAALLSEEYNVKLNNRAANALILKLDDKATEINKRIEKLQRITNDVWKMKKELKAAEDSEVPVMKVSMSYIIFAWLHGQDLAEIAANTKTFEGSIARIISRVNDMISEMQLAAENIGNKELQKTFEEGEKLIKKGVVFAGSLYM